MAISKHLPNIRQGDDYAFAVAYPNATNITGFKFYLTLKNSFDDLDSAAVLQHSVVVGSHPLDDVLNGNAVFFIPASITATVPRGNYYYDFQAIDNSGGILTIAPPETDYKYKLQVIPQVTRAQS